MECNNLDIKIEQVDRKNGLPVSNEEMKINLEKVDFQIYVLAAPCRATASAAAFTAASSAK